MIARPLVFLALAASLAALADEPGKALSREEALKLARTYDGRELGTLWFEHGDKVGPYHHAGRVILGHGDHVSYQVAGHDGTGSETGLYVDEDFARTQLDFFTSVGGEAWVTAHNFKPEVEPSRLARGKDTRSAHQQALGPAAEYAIAEGKLGLLKRLVAHGLEFHEVLNFETGATALGTAVWERQLEITKWLLTQDIDREMRGRWGERPIDLALDRKMEDFCKLLAKPDEEDRRLGGVPEGVLVEIFANLGKEEILFVSWKGQDPPGEVLAWLRRRLHDPRPASRMETLKNRPLGAHSWYRDREDGGFGSLIELSVSPDGEGWTARVRQSTGPFLAGGGWSADYRKRYGYWHGKTTSSWDE